MAEVLIGKLMGPAGFQRPVVIKRVLPHLARLEEFRGMFLDEARIVAGLRHPNVVQVHELGQDGEDLFLVMEYLAGESLGGVSRRLKKRGQKLDPALCAYIISEACAGLHAAHELTDEAGEPQHLVHRDVSPQNIIVTYDGAVKMLDFGIAKAADRYTHTATGQIKGKFPYMAPEQIAGLPLDRRTDIFALGTVLYEAVSGKRLFKRGSQLEIMRAITEDPIPPLIETDPACPAVLNAICMGALKKDKEERYATAAQMRRELVAQMRVLDPHRITQERLAELMRELFPDHIAKKQEMLRRVTADAEVDGAPLFDESDPQAETPSRVGEPRTGNTLSAHEASIRIPSAFGPGTKLAIAALAILAIGLTAWIGVGWGGSEATATGDEQPEFAAEPVAPEVSQVTIFVNSAPPGATVTVAGEERGTTPTNITLSQSDDETTLELRLDGYQLLTETVTPDIDQRLRLSLTREEPPAPPEVESQAPRPSRMTVRAMNMGMRSNTEMDDFFTFQ